MKEVYVDLIEKLKAIPIDNGYDNNIIIIACKVITELSIGSEHHESEIRRLRKLLIDQDAAHIYTHDLKADDGFYKPPYP